MTLTPNPAVERTRRFMARAMPASRRRAAHLVREAMAKVAVCMYNPLDARPLRSRQERAQRPRSWTVIRDTAEFDFETALVYVDERRDYEETRYVALGLLDGRLHVLCFTEASDRIRVISFRKANSREVSRYAKVESSR